MSASTLSQINVFPVKSVGGISLSSAWVEKQGLAFDRRFMLALSDGSMVTARKYPQMVLVTSTLTPDGLIFTAAGYEPLRLRYQDFKMQEAPAQVWKDNFTAYTTTDDADDWFSEVLGQRVELLFTGEQSNRVREKLGHNVSFADGYPLLVISEASLDELNRRSSETHSMDQFRTNLVVSASEPFVEDSWKRIRIGEVEFEAVKPCERCVLTTVDVEKGEFRASKEPLSTLSQFRANERGGVFFGQNLVAKNEGMIRQGDQVEVLEYKEKEVYEDNSPVQRLMTCVEREDIARDFTTFWLEPQHGDMPIYQPGQHLPITLEIDGEQVARRYTLSSSPSRPGRLAISVKRVNGGRVSNWLADHFQVGDTLSCEDPDGRFHIGNKQGLPMLLLSAGSGVTPMMSMLRYLSDHDQVNDVVFYHQCRSVEDIPYKEELDELKRKHQGLTVFISLTQAPIDWFGLKGRLSLSHLKQIKNPDQRQVFVCGPDGFMQKAKNLLLRQGLPESCYHQEAFGVATVAVKEHKSVTISLNGNVFTGDNQKTLLEQAEDAGLPIANSCRAGLCGACKVTVESGKVHQPDVPAITEEERNMGVALACCCVPETDLDIVN
ncbi:flavodoxin [Vibrio caribbeanicus]|uniref:Flavodoxin n=1 Tax=Vibrio caribbeanicus TaxID=701175 RepID=A0ACC4NRI0_9VIBR|nr:hybrid-cluster NAD(P)-dependent oxidoreductase [Vibrio caribbeanicus]KHD23063.1 flavodoxin [Vibrio caribbeanicus]